MKEFNTRQFRDTLSAFATGIAVVTARDKFGKPVAMTVNSFSPVSLTPPLVLWSVDCGSDFFEEFSQADYYAVHVLRQDQQDVSTHFSTEMEDRFADMDTDKGVSNLPLLPNYCARLQCKMEHRYEGGDHLILVGRVLDIDHKPADPLIFHAGKYRTLE